MNSSTENFKIQTSNGWRTLKGEDYANYVIGGAINAVLKIVGFPIEKRPDREMMQYLTRSIKKFHAYLVPEEIVYAFELASNGVFGDEVTTKHYHNLSIEYISAVLNRYKTYRAQEYKKLQDKIEREERDFLAEYVTKVQRNDQTLKSQIKVAYKRYSVTGERKDILLHDWCYWLLDRNNLITADTETKRQAQEEATQEKKDSYTDIREQVEAMKDYNPNFDAMVITVFYEFDNWLMEGKSVEEVNELIDSLPEFRPNDYDEKIKNLTQNR